MKIEYGIAKTYEDLINNTTSELMACLGDVQWYELVNDKGKLEVIGNIHENPDLLEDK